MTKKKLNAKQQYQLDLELSQKKPANRTEGQKAHLAAQLQISRYKSDLLPKLRVGSFRGKKKVHSVRPKKILGGTK